MDASYQSKPTDPRFKDLMGPPWNGRFGRWTILGYMGQNERGAKFWHCRCDCGAERRVAGASLMSVSGTPSRSCGCQAAEQVAARNYRHGLSTHPCYAILANMVARCTNPANEFFHRYGGRGIKIHPPWLDLATFIADVGSPPFPGATIDRIDNNGNYEPGNVRWATPKEQCRNFSRNRIIEHDGVSLTLVEWSERAGIDYHTLHTRLRNGWSEHDALTRPVGRQGGHKEKGDHG